MEVFTIETSAPLRIIPLYAMRLGSEAIPLFYRTGIIIEASRGQSLFYSTWNLYLSAELQTKWNFFISRLTKALFRYCTPLPCKTKKPMYQIRRALRSTKASARTCLHLEMNLVLCTFGLFSETGIWSLRSWQRFPMLRICKRSDRSRSYPQVVLWFSPRRRTHKLVYNRHYF